MNMNANEITLKNENGLTCSLSFKTMMSTLAILKTCKTIARYIVIEDGEETNALDWYKRNDNGKR